MPFDQSSPKHIVEGFSHSSPQESPRSTGPPPNPPFVFPARISPQLSSASFSFSRTAGRRPRSAVETSDRQFVLSGESDSSSRSPTLPAFSFNPGASLAVDSPMLSPPLSPQSPRTVPARPHRHGHKRGGSEYVGGSIRGGDAIAVIGASPTKTESGLVSPTLPPSRPAGRRGHAHRRSAALSSHDLSAIMNPTVGQTPTPLAKPTSIDSSEASNLFLRDSEQKIESEPSRGKSVAQTDNQIQLPPAPEPDVRTPRVGFSDDVEIIPRPLSLISSETSSTVTARPGHSVSGSISSVVSGSPSVPLDPEPIPLLTRSASRSLHGSRPSTAGAILEGIQTDGENTESQSPKRRNSIPALSLAGSASSEGPQPSPSKTPKRWSFFGLEPFIGTSPKQSRPSSSSSVDSLTHNDSIRGSTDNIPKLRASSVAVKSGKSRTKKPGRRQKKKVKAWAGSILIRRGKTKPVKAKLFVSSTNGESASVVASDKCQEVHTDTATPTISTPPMPVVMVTGSPSSNEVESRPRLVADDDGSYPVIDLDAALGPFNTPLPFNPEWEAAQRAGTQPKRKLHSAAGMSHFSGPGGHYHRRAESAPEMVPFEGGCFGIHRFGSSSTMADVFEEDEEEEESGEKTKTDTSDLNESSVLEINESKVNIGMSRDAESSHSGSTPSADSRGLVIDGASSQSDAPSVTTSEDAPIHQSTAPDATILEVSGPAPRDIGDNAQDSPRRIVPIRDLGPVDVSLQLPSASLTPASPFSMTQSSSFPSPRSPMSYDANRVSTAPSSIAEENTFQSLLMGEPGPEVRYSVDADIPSLTSSNSTMTKDSSLGPHPRSSHGNLSGQRPSSFSAQFGRRRSSLASLSRLISSSHGERSKLSVEVTCDSDAEKKAKYSKAKRLSRKLQFWKPIKDTTPSET